MFISRILNKKKSLLAIKIIALLILALAVFQLTARDGAYWTRFKLYRLLLTKPLDEIRADYAARSCSDFSAEEKLAGSFEAFVTGYCKPKPAEFADRQAFLCSVALNCSCPKGKVTEANCSSSSLKWQGCRDFDEKTLPYCHQTASTVEPEPGHVAADWKCFPKNSLVDIDGKSYTVTDKGGLIKGRRFDLWFEDCEQVTKTTGIYKVKLPPVLSKGQ